MSHDEKLHDKLLSYLQDAYAMENQIVEILAKHADQAQDFPDIQDRICRHLDETKQHRARMEQRLNAYGKQPSAFKGALSVLMGNTVGAVSGTRPDTLAMNARDEYVTEHFEIASYTMLMATAQAFGDQETVRAAEMNRRDEIAMQQWLAQHAGEVTLLSLQKSGIAIPDSAWQYAGSIESTMPSMDAMAGATGGEKGIGSKDSSGTTLDEVAVGGLDT